MNFIEILGQLELSFEKRLLNEEFWSDVNAIQQYCHAILKEFDVSVNNLQIVFNRADAFTTNDLRSNHVIVLPIIPVQSSPELAKKLIIARAIILRHELAHVIFTDISKKVQKLGTEVSKTVFAIVEDLRIENLFGQVLKGSKSNFVKIAKPFYREDRPILETQLSIYNCCKYFRYRVQGFAFTKNKITTLYEQIFEKYKYLIYEKDCDQIYDVYNQMYYDIEKLINDNSPHVEPLFAMDECAGEEGIDGEQQDMSENENAQDAEAAKEQQSLEDKSDEEFQDTSSPFFMPEIQNEEDELEEIPSDGKDGDVLDTDEEDENSKQKADQSSQEQKSLQGKNSDDMDSEDIDPLIDPLNDTHEDEKNQNLDVYDTLKKSLASDAQVNKTQPLNSAKIMFDQIFYSGIVVDFYKLCGIVKNSKIFAVRNQGRNIIKYRRAVASNAQAINELVRLFRLKIHNRNKKTDIRFQYEGAVDQNNLQEFVVNAADPRGFYRTIKTISPQSNILIALDFSGSMGYQDISMCLQNALIIMETCRILGINYSIVGFSHNQLSISVSKEATKTQLDKCFKVVGRFSQSNHGYSAYSLNTGGQNYNRVYVPDESIIFMIKSFDDKHSPFHESMMGAMLDDIKFVRRMAGGGTPEFETMMYLYDKYKKMHNVITFLINDGSYNGINSLFRQIGVTNDQLSDDSELFDYRSNVVENGSYDFALSQFDVLYQNQDIADEIEYAIYWQVAKANEISDDVIRFVDYCKNELKDFLISTMSKPFVNGPEENFAIQKYGFVLLLKYMVIDNKKKVIIPYLRYTAKTGEVVDIPQKSSYSGIKRLSYLSRPLFNMQHYIYRGFINQMREKSHWKVIGIGIRTDTGKHYVGNEQFTMVKTQDDIQKQFVKKLEKIF